MADDAPPAPSKPGAPREVYVKNFVPGNQGGVFSENIHGIIFPDHDNRYQDGPALHGALVMQVDPNGRPLFQDVIIKHSGAITAAGITALWTPATGKKARIFGFSIVVDPATTTAAGSLLTITDGATDIDDFLFLGVSAPNVPLRWQCPLNGNGIPSAAINNVIGVKLSAVLSTGGVYINIWGTEE